MLKIMLIVDEPDKKELFLAGGNNRHEFFEELLDFVKNEQIYYRHYETVTELWNIIRKELDVESEKKRVCTP